jgi:hypothetical protein
LRAADRVARSVRAIISEVYRHEVLDKGLMASLVQWMSGGRMNRFLGRLAAIGSAATLVTGLGVGAMALTAAPASAVTGPCSDTADASPTPAHTLPWAQSSSIHINNGTPLTGGCTYFNDTAESHWYMQIYYQGGTYYVWVQRLKLGMDHKCDNMGSMATIDDPHNHVCPLSDWTPP